MNELEENLGPGYKQIVIGLIIFAIGAIWGLILAQKDPIEMGDLYASAVIMLSGISNACSCFPCNIGSSKHNSLASIKLSKGSLDSLSIGGSFGCKSTTSL